MAITQPHPSYLMGECVWPKKWQPPWSDQDWSADSSAAATCVFGRISNFEALWCPNRSSDFDQMFSPEWIIPIYLWFNFHPIPPSGFRVTGEVVTQNTHRVSSLGKKNFFFSLFHRRQKKSERGRKVIPCIENVYI